MIRINFCENFIKFHQELYENLRIQDVYPFLNVRIYFKINIVPEKKDLSDQNLKWELHKCIISLRF